SGPGADTSGPGGRPGHGARALVATRSDAAHRGGRACGPDGGGTRPPGGGADGARGQRAGRPAGRGVSPPGELLQRQAVPDAAPAEVCFQQALAIARRQQAKSWELRATTSLARLWQQQGKHTEARELLAPVYHWFTEGFDTADLQEAKALLEALV